MNQRQFIGSNAIKEQNRDTISLKSKDFAQREQFNTLPKTLL